MGIRKRQSLPRRRFRIETFASSICRAAERSRFGKQRFQICRARLRRRRRQVAAYRRPLFTLQRLEGHALLPAAPGQQVLNLGMLHCYFEMAPADSPARRGARRLHPWLSGTRTPGHSASTAYRSSTSPSTTPRPQTWYEASLHRGEHRGRVPAARLPRRAPRSQEKGRSSPAAGSHGRTSCRPTPCSSFPACSSSTTGGAR